HESGAASGFSLAILPPFMVIALCGVLSQPVYARVRSMEWTQRELARLSAWNLVSVFLPIILFFVGMDQLLRDELRVRSAVAWFGLALVTRVLMALRGARVHGMAPAALTVGELRDR